jgi:hypothetical protein
MQRQRQLQPRKKVIQAVGRSKRKRRRRRVSLLVSLRLLRKE